MPHYLKNSFIQLIHTNGSLHKNGSYIGTLHTSILLLKTSRNDVKII